MVAPEGLTETRTAGNDGWLFQPLHVGLMLAMLIGGFGLAALATQWGQMQVETCGPAGSGCSWNTDEAARATLDYRWAGAILFVAGLVERVVLAFKVGKNNPEAL